MNRRGYLFNCTAALGLLVLWGGAVRLLCPEAPWSAVLENAAFAALLYVLAYFIPRALSVFARKAREHGQKEYASASRAPSAAPGMPFFQKRAVPGRKTSCRG